MTGPAMTTPATPNELVDRLPETPQEELLWHVCDLVSLWKRGVIKGLPRAERNTAIVATRAKIIALVDAGAAYPHPRPAERM